MCLEKLAVGNINAILLCPRVMCVSHTLSAELRARERNFKLFLGDRIGDRNNAKITSACNNLYIFMMMAEEVGFEPTVRVNVRRFSRPRFIAS